MPVLDPNTFGADQPCFGCSPTHPIGFRLRFERTQDDEVVTRFTPGEQHQGPPGLFHGGLVATLADEVAAWTVVGLLSKFGFTAQLEGKLLRPTRIHEEIVGRGRIAKHTGRTVRVAVTLSQREQDVFSGTFVFALLDLAAAEKLLGGPVPEAWRKFAR
jgi:acyl-coenzyme A thioesterase PaaI-like protein